MYRKAAFFSLFFAVFFCFSSYTQEHTFLVTANNTTLHISLEHNEENLAELLLEDKGSLLVKNTNPSIDKEWKRSFFISTTEGNEVADLQKVKENTYCINLHNLLPLLDSSKVYVLYTTAIPKDPEKAKLVRVAPQPVVKLRLYLKAGS